MAAAKLASLPLIVVALLAFAGAVASQQDTGGILCSGGWVRPVPVVGGLLGCPGNMIPSPKIYLKPSPAPTGAGLRVGYYISCPDAEDIVKKVVRDAVAKEPGMGAGLVRLFFHDCFIRGCDASVLLVNSSGSSEPSEMFGVANRESLRGFGVIDAAKEALEAACPNVVSCADIVAFAARDASVVLSNGRINFAMPAGRHDGRVSLASDTNDTNLPGPFTDLQTIKNVFASKGLDTKDMVTLSGAHTVGHGRCGFIRPDMNTSLTRDLRDKCSGGNNNTAVVQDYKTPHILDSQYYQNVNDNAVLFQSDAALSSGETKPLVDTFAADLSGGRWEAEFAEAMVKMGNIEVKTSPGADAEIRKKCSIYN